MDPNFNWLESLEHTQQAIRRTQPPAPEPCDHPDRVPGSDDEEEDLEATSAGVRRPEAGPSVGRGTGLAGRAGPLRDVRPGVNALPEGAGLGPGTPVSGEYVQRGPARPKALPRESPGAGVELARRTQFGISGEGASDCSYWVVQWRKPQTKKHKTWDGDAYLKVVKGEKVFMIDEDGKCMGTTGIQGAGLVVGATLRVGSYETEVDRSISQGEFQHYTCILNRHTTPANVYVKAVASPSTFVPPFKTPTLPGGPRSNAAGLQMSRAQATPNPAAAALTGSPAIGRSSVAPVIKPVQAANFYASKQNSAGKQDMTGKAIAIGKENAKAREKFGGAAFDPNAEGAVVMSRPTEAILKAMKATEDDVVDVVLDPLLAVKMRAHQKDGVKFMYRCVMGYSGANAQGCILADEMGLGKTLQTIALIHTLFRQSPFPNQTSVIQKALIVCPVTLVKNWRNEFRKWVGDRVGVCAVEGTDDLKLHAFLHTKASNVLVIGYERLRKVINQLKTCQPPVGLIVCDEGHRLKSKDSKTTKMFDELNTGRRIILSGTPVQNDLEEYWSMADFCCPNLLGKYSQFNRQYEKPILKSRSVKCSAADLEEGQMRAKELSDLSKEFVIRRTAAVLENYLPPKYEYVVFVAPTLIQLEAFGKLLQPSLVSSILNGDKALQLGLIDPLRKVASSPMMVKMKDVDSASESSSRYREAILSCIPKGMDKFDPAASGKLIALDRMLIKFNTLPQPEKVVIVSSYVTTLNLIEGLCKQRKYPLLRLDGSTPAKQRQELVNNFNRSTKRESFVFLLSAKAGGTGINLIGASRLILFDSDWNPSTDLQAMARIHRDGQKNSVYIYRLLTTNSIDEKIYQRQITKTGLSDQMLDHSSKTGDSKDSFSAAELRDIFSVNLATDGCQTHDLLGCDCLEKQAASLSSTRASSPEKPISVDDDDEERNGFMVASQYDPEPTPKMRQKMAAEQQQKLAALKAWTHVDAFEKHSFSGLQDNILYDILRQDWELSDAPGAADVEPFSKKGRLGSPVDDNMDDVGDSDDDDDAAVDLTWALPRRPTSAQAVDDEAEGVDGKDEEPVIILTDEDDEEDDDPEFDSVLPSRIAKRKAHSAGRKIISSPSSNTEEDSAVLPKRSSRASAQSVNKKGKMPKPADNKRKRKSLHDVPSKRHDLQQIAEKGQAGRIMFVFEKISSSKIANDDDDDGSP